MGDRHALGQPGGARGVDQVGDVVGLRVREALWPNASVARRARRRPRPPTTVEPAGQVGGGDDRDRGGVGEHELDPRRRQRRVDRQVGRPGLQHRQDRGDRLGRARQQQRHRPTRDPHRGRPARAPTGRPPRRVRRRSTTGPRRSAPPPPGCGPPARRTAPDQRLADSSQVAVSTARLPTSSNARPLRPSSSSTDDSAQRWDRPSPPLSTRSSRPTSASTLAASYTSVRNSTVPPMPAARPSAVQRSPRENVRSMRAVLVSTGIGVTCRSPRASPPAACSLTRQVLPGHHDLHQRMVGEAAGGVEPLHQHLEGHVLVLEGREAAPLHLRQQVGEAWVAGHLDPQHQRVDEEADQVVERGVASTGDREAHRHIGSRADRRTAAPPARPAPP